MQRPGVFETDWATVSDYPVSFFPLLRSLSTIAITFLN